MSLINEQQRDSSQVNKPSISELDLKPVTSEAFSDSQAYSMEADLPIPEAKLEQVDPTASLKPTSSAEVPKPNYGDFGELPKLQTEANLTEVSPYEPTVVNTQLPTLYTQPAYTPALSQADKLLQDITSRPQVNPIDTQANWAKQTLENNRGLLNTPDADKPFTQTFTGWLGDVVFGNEQARKRTEEGNFSPLVGEFGRAGAGLGGLTTYVFSTPLNFTVGVIADTNVAFANVLENFGLSRKDAEAFAHNGLFNFLPWSVPNPFEKRAVLEDGKPIRLEQTPIRIPKPSDIIGFNFDAARKQSNILSALRGNQVADIGDPRESTETDTGRVFYNPRRKVGDSIAKDPLGLGLEVGLNIFDPLGNKIFDPAFNKVFGFLFGKTPSKVGQVVNQVPETLRYALPPSQARTPDSPIRPTPPVNKPPIDLTKLTEEQLRQQRVGTPRLTGSPELPALPPSPMVDDGSTYKVTPSAPPAANPSKVVRIPTSGTSVSQRLLPPVVNPTLVPPSRLTEVLPIPKSNPTNTMLKVGIGTPSTEPITDLGQLSLRPYTQVVEQIELTNPKLLEGYSGVTWNDLKAHLSRQPKIDLSEFNVVGSELPKALPPTSAVAPVVNTPETTVNIPVPKAIPPSSTEPELPKALPPTSAELRVQPELTKETIEEYRRVNNVIQSINTKREAGEEFLDLSIITGESQSIPEFNGLSYETDVAPRLETALSALESGEQKLIDASVNLLTQFVRKNQTYENISKSVNADVRKIVDDLWYQLVSKSSNENLSKQVNQIVNTTPENISTQEKLILDRLGYSWDGKLWKKTPSKPSVDITVPKPTTITKDDLATAAQELAAHKQAIQAPLNQLEQLAIDSVDFGRRALENGGYKSYTYLQDIRNIIDNGGRVDFHPFAFEAIPQAYRGFIQSGDFLGLLKKANQNGVEVNNILRELWLRHESILKSPAQVNPTKPTKAITSLPKDLYHGTALANWTPNYNLSVYGSRGELGSGLYLSNKPKVADQYALARMSDNANPETLDFDLSPATYRLKTTLERTLDARAKLPSNDDFYKRLAEGLPEELKSNLLKSISRAKTTTYSGFLTKLESNLVRSGIEPTEEILQQVQKTISDNLRRLGYDSVFDKKSGYAVVLDETKVSVVGQKTLQQTDEAGAALARYNADAYSSKFFPERLTTDANLRDSTMRLLNQVRQNVDNKLAGVQHELIKRGDDYEGVLPELTDDAPVVNKPKTAAEILEDIDIDSICG